MSISPTQSDSSAARFVKPHERRRSPRIKHECRAQLIAWPSSSRTAPIDVTLVDYSRTGVGLVHDEAMLVGQKFVLREPYVTRDSSCLYTVARCDKMKDGHFSIGMRLSAMPVAETEPLESHDSSDHWLKIGYFFFALLGAASVVAMALWSRTR